MQHPDDEGVQYPPVMVHVGPTRFSVGSNAAAAFAPNAFQNDSFQVPDAYTSTAAVIAVTDGGGIVFRRPEARHRRPTDP